MLLAATTAMVVSGSVADVVTVLSVAIKRSSECHPMPIAPANNNDDTATDPTVSNFPIQLRLRGCHIFFLKKKERLPYP